MFVHWVVCACVCMCFFVERKTNTKHKCVLATWILGQTRKYLKTLSKGKLHIKKSHQFKTDWLSDKLTMKLENEKREPAEISATCKIFDYFDWVKWIYIRIATPIVFGLRREPSSWRWKVFNYTTISFVYIFLSLSLARSCRFFFSLSCCVCLITVTVWANMYIVHIKSSLLSIIIIFLCWADSNHDWASGRANFKCDTQQQNLNSQNSILLFPFLSLSVSRCWFVMQHFVVGCTGQNVVVIVVFFSNLILVDVEVEHECLFMLFCKLSGSELGCHNNACGGEEGCCLTWIRGFGSCARGVLYLWNVWLLLFNEMFKALF